MASRKETVISRNDLANKLAKLELGKTEAKVGDVRELLKRLVQLEAAGYVASRKSALLKLRKEAVIMAKKIKAKKTKTAKKGK